VTSEVDKSTPGLSRAGLVAAALGLVQEEGLEALSMRGLADRLHVKASSLYWHVRDRRELLELLAESILNGVAASHAREWRAAVLQTVAALSDAVAKQRDADRILLEVPDAVQRSEPFRLIKRRLQDAGLQPSEASDVALMAMAHVLGAHAGSGELPMPASGTTASIAVDSGSRGVILRNGTDLETLIRVPHDPAAASPAIVHGETVKVRRLRGVGRGDIELNPRHPWRFRSGHPEHVSTWQARATDKLDGGAKVECFLPRPRCGAITLGRRGGVTCTGAGRRGRRQQRGAVRIKLGPVFGESHDPHSLESGRLTLGGSLRDSLGGGAMQVTLDDKATPLTARTWNRNAPEWRGRVRAGHSAGRSQASENAKSRREQDRPRLTTGFGSGTITSGAQPPRRFAKRVPFRPPATTPVFNLITMDPHRSGAGPVRRPAFIFAFLWKITAVEAKSALEAKQWITNLVGT
jgi:TetR/AcrR family tetracycline transcriptional repressor